MTHDDNYTKSETKKAAFLQSSTALKSIHLVVLCDQMCNAVCLMRPAVVLYYKKGTEKVPPLYHVTTC